MRAELAGEANPISGRMRVVKVRGLAVEAFAAVFLFKGPVGQADVGLSSSFAFFEWIHTFSVPQNLNGRVGVGGEGRIDAGGETLLRVGGVRIWGSDFGWWRPECPRWGLQ